MHGTCEVQFVESRFVEVLEHESDGEKTMMPDDSDKHARVPQSLLQHERKAPSAAPQVRLS